MEINKNDILVKIKKGKPNQCDQTTISLKKIHFFSESEDFQFYLKTKEKEDEIEETVFKQLKEKFNLDVVTSEYYHMKNLETSKIEKVELTKTEKIEYFNGDSKETFKYYAFDEKSQLFEISKEAYKKFKKFLKQH